MPRGGSGASAVLEAAAPSPSVLVRTGIDWFSIQDPVAVRVWLFGVIGFFALGACFYLLFLAQRDAKQPSKSEEKLH